MGFSPVSLNVKGSMESHYGWSLVGDDIVILALAGDGFILSFLRIWWPDPLGSTGLTPG